MEGTQDPVSAAGAGDPKSHDRAIVLDWAKEQRKRHRTEFRQNKWLFVGFQSLTIASAASATILAVADPHDISALERAIPAAIATLGAAVLAAFNPLAEKQRHATAERQLDYEIVKFENKLREYRDTTPRPEPDGVDLFLSTVEKISRDADQEPELSEPDVPQPEAD